MLDVHVLTLPDSRQDWLQQCLASVDAAARAAPFPVGVHVVDGVAGHIGLGRARGFALGESPFVTYVDDDDFVDADAFACLSTAFESSPRLIFTQERMVQNEKPAGCGGGHHLAVLRREDAIAHDWSNHPAGGEAELYRSLGPWVQLPNVVYTHRLYRSRGRALRAEHSR